MADNLTREREQEQAPTSRYPVRPQVPVGLVVNGRGVSVTYTMPARTMEDDARSAANAQFQGGGGSFADYFASLEAEVDNARISRYFGDLNSGYASATDSLTNETRYSPEAFEEYMNQSLLSPADGGALGLENTEDDILLDLMAGGNGIRGMYDRAIQLSFDDPELFTIFQMQLVQHGFVSDQLNFGQMDDATTAAIQAMIDGKIQVGDDMSMTSYLERARTTYFDRTFEEGFGDLEAADAETASQLRALREQIESQKVVVNLSNPEDIKRQVQQQAVNMIGRRLSDAELSGVVEGVHEGERADFYSNNPQLDAYNALVRQWEDAVSNTAERRSSVLTGQDGSDLDEFMAAIMDQESGGKVDAVNPHSGAFGLYQFMPGTWANVTRNAGLDPNDKTEQNQTAAARYLMATYFRQFGNWRDVAIAWYAGPGGVKYNDAALNAGQSDNHPSINAYADQIIERMNGTYNSVDLNAEVDLDLTGLTPQLIQAYLDGKYQNLASKNATLEGGQGLSDLDSELAKTVPGSPQVAEEIPFDITSYLQSAVNERGGVEADSYNYANRAMEFFGLLGRR